ncbi:MAG TPA: SIS domain-containing protein [Rectinemataceae bacterium]|nr:SIS domain-containing protein [Rectinemataceae bacterium]
MCGIVSLIYKTDNPAMGREAEALLRRLEYRGYDSTGASFIGDAREIVLLKKTGAPSKVCPALRIAENSGQRFIGQVRWATYGAVTDINSQPHHVSCKIEMVGAHNGNISNTDSLKTWLSSRGHAVVSDNDGEIIVHLVEEHYASNQRLSSADLAGMRQAYAASGLREGVPDGVLRMIDAIRKAEALAEGSYAAAVADPKLPGVFAIKSGSSLYAGVGSDAHGNFIVVSSDLTSVLSKTRALIPLSEGEGLWFTENNYLLFNLRGAPAFSRPKLKRSKLSVRDTQLSPRFKHYMEQEILGSPDNMDQILRYYFRNPKEDALGAIFEERKDECKESADELASLSEKFGDDLLRDEMEAVFTAPSWADVSARVAAAGKGPQARDATAGPAAKAAKKAVKETFASDEAELLSELAKLAPQRAGDLALMDSVFVWRKRRAVLRYLSEFKSALTETNNSGGRIYLVASGTSYHAALTAAYFFNGIAHLPIYPCNPGIFRSMYFSCLRADDFILGITQSGETKDLVDIFQDVKEKNPRVRRACLVNNENSRIPQELSDFYLPILCGPEIAVAATKSFMNQLAILYLMASSLVLPEREVKEKLLAAKKLMEDSIEATIGDIETAAARLYAKPSIHILGTGLIGLAREGALKIREVVLNHTEGYDAAEFKHGPNTILGRNTLFSLSDMENLLNAYKAMETRDKTPIAESARETLARNPSLVEGLFSAYPLVFVCPPEDRDVRITISQIHTHKIRGADIILIAERRQDLALAVAGKPMGDEGYWSKYIEIPHTGDPFIFVFGATIVLQYLAYRMSVRKMEWLNGLGVADHGVHPDAPKNVSKSITVD